jgi:hypothetical protein
MVARAFDAGWAGVFYKTICMQEIQEVSPRFDAVKNGSSFSGFRNMEQLSENPVDMDFDILRRLKLDYPSKVVVASIMGQTEEQWIELAKMAEAAGVDAVELNFSCPQMRLTGMGSDGAKGMLDMRKMGAYNIAESADTAVVYGMPKAAAENGAANISLSLDNIAGHITAKLKL